MNEKIFRGGVPTGPDVRVLMERFPPSPGRMVEYASLAEALGLDARASRFKTVVVAWRKRLLREQNVDTEAVPGLGIRWLAENERTPAAAKQFGRGIRTVGRGLHRAAVIRTELLTERERDTATHVRRVMGSVYEAARSARKEIAVALGPAPQLPRGK